MRTALADTAFRIRCSWWAPWAVIAASAAAIGSIYGYGYWSLTPAAAGITLLAAHPTLRGKATAGAKLAGRAAMVRYHWRTWMAANTKTFAYASHPIRAIIVGSTQQTPRIKRFERDGRHLVAIVESPRFFDASMWRQNGDDIARGLRLQRPTISIDQAKQEARLTFIGGTGQIKQWTTDAPTKLPDLTRVPIARTHTGTAYARILGSHMLITGATGSGKGSVVWSIVRELSPGIPTGEVELWAVDGKAGVELGMGRPLFSRFCGEIGAEFEPAMVALLEDAVATMSRRLKAMTGTTRTHTPRPGEPLIVVIYDEFLTVVATMADRDMKRRADIALKLLLSQGRAAGVVVIAAAQLAQKETIGPIRDLIPTRVCLRVADAEQVDLSLGVGARKAGAAAHEIPDTEPGTGYLLEDGRTPTIVRFPWMPDEQIRAIAAKYPAPRALTFTPAPAQAPVREQPQTKMDLALAFIASERGHGREPTPQATADAADCTVRYAKMALTAASKPGNPVLENRSAPRNGVPSGDPISKPGIDRSDTPHGRINPSPPELPADVLSVPWVFPDLGSATA